MEIHVNILADFYARSNISFYDAFRATVEPGSKTTGNMTSSVSNCLIFPLSGRACFHINNTPYIMELGNVFHAGTGMTLDKEVLGEKPWEYVLIYYMMSDTMHPSHHWNDHFKINTGYEPRITEIVQQLIQYHSRPDSMATLRVKTLFSTLIEEIIISARKQLQFNHGEIIAEAIEYIHKHYMDPISIVELASQYKLDGRRFAYIFQKQIGMSPINYLIDYRIRRAKELLQIQPYTVQEVANCVGYRDSFYFSKLFKKRVGISPSKFQNRSSYS